MTVIASLPDAIEELVHDGDTIALEGFTHLIPVAAGHEIIRQRRRDLTVIRMTPDIIYDQLIGAGCVRKMIFSWGGNPGVGSLYRFRDAVEKGWPRPLEIEEHSHAGMANRYAAGASGLPFAVLRGYRGTDLVAQTATLAPITCPFTGEELTAVPALNPDVSIIHAQQADRVGNVMLWGIIGVQKEALLAARRALVTVEELVDELTPRPGSIVIPSWAVSQVAEVPGGAHPSYAQGYSTRDNDYYRAWDAISADRDRFTEWLDRSMCSAAPGCRHDRQLTPDDAMTIAAARCLDDGAVCFVGIGLPSTAANLARRTHAPNLVLVYESGTLGSKPERLPLSIGDGELADTADSVISVPEVFNYWLQPGRIDVGFLSGAQIDRFANINSTVIGDYAQPKVRLPGAGGAPEIAASCGEVVVMLRHSTRAFVDRVDFVSSVGFGAGPGCREKWGLRGRGPQVVVTDLALLRPDPATCELTLTALQPGATVDDVKRSTGWDLAVADDVEELAPPTPDELDVLRRLQATIAPAGSAA